MIPGIGSGAARCPERVVVSGEGADRVCTSRSERHAARDDAGPALTAERDEGTGGPAGGTG